MRQRVFLLFWVIMLPGFLAAQRNFITGYVFDSLSKQPIINVNITMANMPGGTSSNQSGYFKIDTRFARTVLYFSHLGYSLKEVPIFPGMNKPIVVYLTTETKQLGEVIVYPDYGGVHKVLHGDSLNILDYEVTNDKILIVASPLNDKSKQRIYLTSLSGFILSYRDLKDVGKEIDFPDEPGPRLIYLWKDMYGEVQLLTQKRVWQVFIKGNEIFLIYPTGYEVCYHNLFPIRGCLKDKLIFQESNEHTNITYFMVRGSDKPKRLRQVNDEYGDIRYVWQRNVVVPVIVWKENIVIFDFFKNEISFYNYNGREIKTISTLFHTKWYYDWFHRKAYDLDKNKFTQQIFVDPATERVYSLWKTVATGRYSLKELNMETGEVIRVIEVPEYYFITKVKVIADTAYFLYKIREEQKFTSLFTMDLTNK